LLTGYQYAVMAEIMGHALYLAPQATNCAAPDTGNMGECDEVVVVSTDEMPVRGLGEVRHSRAEEEIPGRATRRCHQE
jgi:hypothetical protein